MAAATALPRKPTKVFPKKFDSSFDGLKDTYGNYEIAPDMDYVVPAESPFLDGLVPPSSYDAYFERQPQDSLLPPDGSTYTGVKSDSEGEALAPPPVDSYSVAGGIKHLALVPPPVSVEAPADQESYVAYKGEGEEWLVAPPLSSYAQAPTDKSGAEVLASLAAMVHSLPRPSSYGSYQPATTLDEAVNAPSRMLRPPSAQETREPLHSSYSEIPVDTTPLTPEQILASQEALIPLPSIYLLPPTL